MKIRNLTLTGLLLLGAIATAATAMQPRDVPAVDAPEIATTAAIELSITPEELALVLPSWFATAPDDGDGDGGKVTACGDGFPVASPKNGITGQGSHANQPTAMEAAIADATSKCIAYSGIKCAECEIPDDCQPSVDLLDSEWVFDGFQAGGLWYCTATYKGPYIAYCTACGD